jgi:MFS family permease
VFETRDPHRGSFFRALLRRYPGRFATTAGVSTTVVTVLPVFLVGGLSVQLAADTGLGPIALGLVVAVYWMTSAICSPAAGRVAAATGSRGGMLAAITLGGLALLGAATVVHSWQWFTLWLVIAGVGNSLGHPPSNALIGARVGARNRAFAYGIKQAAIPLATLLAGLAVPTIALTVGWQWTFVTAGVFAAIVLVFVALVVPVTESRLRPRTKDKTARAEHRVPRSLMHFLVLTSIASGLGSAQANVIGAFTVSSAVASGFSTATAGLLLSLGSLAGILARPIAGIAADRGVGGTLRTVALMLAAGAVGLLGMASGLPIAFAIGCMLAFGLGWGWNGLIHYVVSHSSDPHAAQATGIVQAGAYFGSAAGPLVFGFIFAGFGPATGWIAAAVVALAAAVLALVAHRNRPMPHLDTEGTS